MNPGGGGSNRARGLEAVTCPHPHPWVPEGCGRGDCLAPEPLTGRGAAGSAVNETRRRQQRAENATRGQQSTDAGRMGSGLWWEPEERGLKGTREQRDCSEEQP